jgi:hypothetical protein
MKTFSFVVATLMCGWTIFFTELARKEIAYDCHMLIGGWHPDIQQQVIKQCRG